MSINLNELKNAMNVEDAAQLLGVHPETLKRAIRNKKLVAYLVGVKHKILQSDLQSYVDTLRSTAK